MNHFTFAATCAAKFCLTPLTAAAGEASLNRSDGMQLSGQEARWKLGAVAKTSGGSKNFKKLKAKYEDMGFTG